MPVNVIDDDVGDGERVTDKSSRWLAEYSTIPDSHDLVRSAGSDDVRRGTEVKCVHAFRHCSRLCWSAIK